MNLNSILFVPSEIEVDVTEKDYLMASAQKILDGIYNLLGSGDVKLIPINWHIDFKTGFKWSPGKFFRLYRQEDINTNTDVKVPRELSRCHHLLKLGLAYKLTNNERYAKICVEQMGNWIENNPLMYSINWGCTMDVAIRAVNWIWTLNFISGSKELDNDTMGRIRASLFQHGWYIWRNPEKSSDNNGNHYIADLTGQIILGLLFKNTSESQLWLEKGKEELFREIRLEILPSGMTYERSTNYNRLVLELIIVPVLLLKANGYEIPQDIWYRIEKMFEFIMHILKPDGTAPIIGDQDNGRLLPFNAEETIDFRYLLSLGALLYNRPDLKHYGNGFNAYCSILGGRNAQIKWNSIPNAKSSLCSRAFPDIGLYVMRKEGNYLLFNATGRGLYPELRPGAHTHSDLFSFELFTHGRSFLIDPGSYVYSGDADQRLLFRSSKMHNTVTVDGESQDIMYREKLWDFERNAIPEVRRWESTDKYDTMEAAHNGYMRLQEPVIHERKIIFNKEAENWIIEDNISGKGRHTCEWYFHFDSNIDFKIESTAVNTLCKDGKNINIKFDTNSGLLLRKESSFISKSYGNKQHGYVLVAIINQIVPIKVKITISKMI